MGFTFFRCFFSEGMELFKVCPALLIVGGRGDRLGRYKGRCYAAEGECYSAVLLTLAMHFLVYFTHTMYTSS